MRAGPIARDPEFDCVSIPCGDGGVWTPPEQMDAPYMVSCAKKTKIVTRLSGCGTHVMGTMKRHLGILALSLGLAAPATAQADTVAEILIDRRADQVSLYFALPAADLEPLFGKTAEPLLGPDGTVDIDGLYEGTYLLADDIFADARVSIGGQEVPVEALSMMLHDPEFLPGFIDPYDAQVSIAVCTSPETVRGMGLSELDAYLGYFAWNVDGHQPVEISFSETGRGDMTISVRDFVDFELVSAWKTTIPDGATLSLTAERPAAQSPVAEAASFGFMALCFAIALFYFGRRTLSRPESNMGDPS